MALYYLLAKSKESPTVLNRERAGRKSRAANAVLTVLGSGVLVAAAWSQSPAVTDSADATHTAGKLANGSSYVLDRPAKWNGELIIDPDLTIGRGDSAGKALRALGFATATRSRDVTTWQVRDGSTDLVELKSLFTDLVGKPKKTMLIGGSLGGLVTRDAARDLPQIFDGTVPTLAGEQASSACTT